jgi:hypothetical protein
MFRNFLSAVILLGVASMPFVARAATPFELKSVKIDLPDSDRMFRTVQVRTRSTTTASPVTQPAWC